MALVNKRIGTLRGLNGPSKQKDVLSFCGRNKVGIMGLVETKVRRCNYDKVAHNFLRWNHYVQYNALEKGRLWLMWILEDFIVQIIQSTPQAIHYWITHSFSRNTFYLTLVYGDNDEMERKRLWEMLISLANNG